MFNTPETNFISSLRKNFINFAGRHIQKLKIALYRDMSQYRNRRPLPFANKTRLQNA